MTGGVTTGGLPPDYQFGPRETEADKAAIREAFTRKVAIHTSDKKYLKVDPGSFTFQKARAYFQKKISEREVVRVPLPSQLHHQETRKSTPNPSHALSSQNLLTKPTPTYGEVQEQPLDLNNNVFLTSDGKKLSNTEPEKVSETRRHSFQDIAKKAANLTSTSRAFSRQNSLSDHLLVGFDKVANYENQGIPPDYIRQTQAVADQENVLIAIRPVEKICRTLIEEGYASKPLSIKGKSSNWGPMAGFIPVDQHFSKLSGNPQKVATFNEVNHQAIEVDKVATKEHLHLSEDRLNELEEMEVLKNLKSTFPAPGYIDGLIFESAPKGNAGPPEFFEAHQREDGQWDVFSGTGDDRKPLTVIPVTADFDLLFVHSRLEDVDLGQQDRYGELDPVLGIYSKRKLEVINALNTAYGRKDKPMVHHGTDNKNPYTDMKANIPATVMIPKSMIGKLGIYTQSPILIKTEEELAKLYRAMRDHGIKIEINPLWEKSPLKDLNKELIKQKINGFEQNLKGRNHHG